MKNSNFYIHKQILLKEIELQEVVLRQSLKSKVHFYEVVLPKKLFSKLLLSTSSKFNINNIVKSIKKIKSLSSFYKVAKVFLKK